MDILFKRVLAYLMDILIVSFVVTNLTSSSKIDFQLDKRNDLYQEYAELSKNYKEQSNNDIKNCEDLVKAIEDEKLTETKYVEKIENLLEENSSNYEQQCQEVVSEYNNNKISAKDYATKVEYYNKNITKNSTFFYLLNVVLCFLYFVLFQGFTGGQTLGKKVMHLKVISDDKKEVSYKQLFIRTIFLYDILYDILLCLFSFIIPVKYFYFSTRAIDLLNYALNLVIVFTICYSIKRKGLHDILAKTRVIMIDSKGNELEESIFTKKNKDNK